MRLCLAFVAAPVSLLAACGPASNADVAIAQSSVFSPPPPKPGFTRIVAPVIPDIEPGGDVTYCQYVMAPLDHDVDILEVGGYQSAFGHHAVAYATTAGKPVGTSGPCGADETMSGGFLGGIGGEGTTGVVLPDNVGFRLGTGKGILLNTHFINTGTETVDGHIVLDVKFADVDPARMIASLLTNATLSISVPAGSSATADAVCTVPRPFDFVMFGNHMHDHGTSVVSTVLRADGSSAIIHEDQTWTRDMQFNAPLGQWPSTAPFHVASGETIRTHCTWENPTADALAFPSEMCIGFGFFLSDVSTSPVCIDGTWSG